MMLLDKNFLSKRIKTREERSFRGVLGMELSPSEAGTFHLDLVTMGQGLDGERTVYADRTAMSRLCGQRVLSSLLVL